MRRAGTVPALAVAALLWPGTAAGFDSTCYRHGDDTCAPTTDSLVLAECEPGPDAARNRWYGFDDEHRQLFAAAVAGLGLPEYLTGGVSIDVFLSGGSPGSLAPAAFGAADVIRSRCYGIDEMAQLPDFSYGLWDWTSGNETCPLDAVGAVDCHKLGLYMGPVNSSHFVPQSSRWFMHYHGIALQRAAACADVRQRLDGLPQFAPFVQACDQEAFTYEAVAHHFLQDAWSTGHMWQRWGSSELTDFPGGRDTAVIVALTSGILHGARATVQSLVPSVDWRDPLCAPLDPIRYPVPGVSHPVQYTDGGTLRTGVGDLYLSTMATSYPWQLARVLDCERGAIAEVALAAGLSPSVPAVSALSAGFINSCFGQRVTNESVLLGSGLDGILPSGQHVRAEIDGLVGPLVEIADTAGALSSLLSPLAAVTYQRELALLGEEIRARAKVAPLATDLANGGLRPLLGVQPNGAASYDHSPPARYADPVPPFQVAFSGSDGDPANLLARAFHRAHATDWCAVTTTDDLESLRVPAGLDPGAAGDRCRICVEIAGRHMRIGEDEEHYDGALEPLCHALVDQPAYVYQKVDDGSPTHAALAWCGCDQHPDGGMDGGRDAGAGGGGDAGGASPGACVGSPEFCSGLGSSPPGGWGSGGPGSDWGGLDDQEGALIGDPHAVTLDGLMFDFQVVGEFVLLDDGAGLTVQVRQAPWNGTSRGIARVAAVAARVGAGRVGLYAGEALPLHVDGQPVDLHAGDELPLPGGGSVSATGAGYLLGWPTGERLDLRLVGDHIDVHVHLPRGGAPHWAGLLGDGDGSTQNDLVSRDGRALPRPVAVSDLYGGFASSWRITQVESLFDYPAGQGTADFTDLTFPSKIVSAATLPASSYAAGLRACTENGVLAPGVLEACVLDYGTTLDPAVVREYLGMPAPLETAPLAYNHDDFETANHAALTNPPIGQVPAGAVLASNHYAGPFSDQQVGVTLQDLPDHTTITIAFDLYVMGAWNADEWDITLASGSPLLATSFSNLTAPQAYPDFRTAPGHPPQTDAAAIGALSPPGSGAVDAIYHLRFTIPHVSPTLALRLQAPLLAGTPGATWGIDNLEIQPEAIPGATSENILGIDIIHGPPGDPAVVGCADGRREALLDSDGHPDIAGCLAQWTGIASLRAPATGVPCGDGIGPCNAPADACAPGWHPCASSGSVDELRRISGAECLYPGGGRFLAAMSACLGQGPAVCDYATEPTDRYPCLDDGACADAVCCGTQCWNTGCTDAVWPGLTFAPLTFFPACGATVASPTDGLLCCR